MPVDCVGVYQTCKALVEEKMVIDCLAGMVYSKSTLASKFPKSVVHIAAH